MKTLNLLVAGAGILVLASCSHKKNTPTADNSGIFNVHTEQPKVYNGQHQFAYSGVVEARKTTALSFATMGTVTEIFADEGQAVSKGQLLAKVNATNAQNAYQAARAKQLQAEDAYNRLKPMKENGTLPEIKWVEVETGVEQAKAAVAIAQKNVSDCNLYAPQSGVIGKQNVQVGMNVMPTTTVLELVNIESVYVKIPVSENEVSRFKKGESAQITINALNKTITGIVKEIGVTADILSHTYPIKIEVQNADGDIKPGMICSVQTITQDKRSGWLVSNKALQNDVNGSQFIYVEQNGKAAKVPVQTLSLIGNQILVQGEMAPTAHIIISGQQKLSNGTPVRIIK